MRTIITKNDLKKTSRRDTGTVNIPDNYFSRLVKYIPTEVVALYIALSSLVVSSGDASSVVFWAILVFGIIVTPLYLWRILKVSKVSQLGISTIAFIIWAFALGGPFASLGWYKPLYGGILVICYTFVVPMIEA